MSPTTRQTVIIMILVQISAPTTLQAQEPTGGAFHRLVSHLRQHRSPMTSSATVATVQTPSAPPIAGCDCNGGSDPYGFTTILNHLRARAGLYPVAYDPELSSWASQNNSAQCHRGIGHHVNPCCVQNCGWNYPDASTVAQGWMNSPGHRRNLLSPSISRFGIAFGPGPYWTLNAR
jgi:uncharacterized protein YkwD